MQVISSGTRYTIHDSSIQTHNQLPAKVFKINFSQQTGFSLVESDPIVIDEKIYGTHLEKVEKVYHSFKIFPRNLGIILSGAKGIGKSLFAKLLSMKAIENGYPIIVCDAPYPGIADFLGSIQQEIVILFDEFDKTFKSSHDGDFDPQAAMLTLFDGLYMGKKMFIVTCNGTHNLNEFLVNRPGRFHYHFRFGFPNGDEITEYLKDNVYEEYWSEIPSVVSFSKKVDLNFDCLRAIAFELNLGSTFANAITDLNIVNTESQTYDITAYFEDGTIFTKKGVSIDLFEEEFSQCLYIKNSENCCFITFNPQDATFDYSKNCMTIPGQDVDYKLSADYYDLDDDSDNSKALRERLNGKLLFITLGRVRYDKNFHYAV